MIEVLKEQKQAIINHAVTKGFDPNVKLKPSGIDYLGDIPQHWEVLPIKRLVKTKMGDGPHETPRFVDSGIPFVSVEAAHEGRIHLADRRGDISYELHKEYCKKIKPQRDDIFIVKSGSTTGKVCIVDFDEEFSIWSPLALVRCNHRITPLFMYYALTTAYFQKQVQDRWSFGTQPNIGMGVLQNLKVLFPTTIHEQTSIIKFIKTESDNIDMVINRTEKEIELIREYRISLISDVVTGKIDVRDVEIEPVESNDEIKIEDLEEIQEDEGLAESQENLEE